MDRKNLLSLIVVLSCFNSIFTQKDPSFVDESPEASVQESNNPRNGNLRNNVPLLDNHNAEADNELSFQNSYLWKGLLNRADSCNKCCQACYHDCADLIDEKAGGFCPIVCCFSGAWCCTGSPCVAASVVTQTVAIAYFLNQYQSLDKSIVKKIE